MIRPLFYMFSFINLALNTSLFTSISKLEQLARSEKDMLAALGTYIHDAEKDNISVPENVQTFYKELSHTSAESLQPGFMGNPINAYHFIRRMHVTWREIISDIDCETCALSYPQKAFQNRLKHIEDDSGLQIQPSREDLQWAALGIVRLWQTYKLHLPTLFRGEIRGKSTQAFSLDDIFYICNQLEDKNEFYKAIIWLRELLRESTELERPLSNKNRTRATRMLAGAYSKYGMPWVSVDLLKKQIVIADDSDISKLKRDLIFYTNKVADVPSTERTTVALKPRKDDIRKEHYEALCRGDVPRRTKVLSKLRCFYRKTLVPVYRAKEEILNYAPRISLFHDVLTDSEILGIKTQAMSSLKTSTIVGSDVIRNTFEFNYRISQTAWLSDDTSELIKRVSRRISLITGLSTQQSRTFSHSEELQVLNYGVGGMYEPHEDYFEILIHENPTRADDPFIVQGTGDRMATWMFYLNDVTAGGATVFLKLNITIPVEKGAAAFWYNVKRNGDLDTETTHAGCPVLLGSKWVANKWIRQHGQIFRRKCGRTINSLDIPLGK